MTPSTRAVELAAESMLATSLEIKEGHAVENPEDAWTRRKGGWTSENWTDAE